MITERIDKKLMDKCMAYCQLSPTISEDTIIKHCDNCDSSMVPMRLDKSPNSGSGFMPQNDKCLFDGCRGCNTLLYDEDELTLYAGRKTGLKEFLFAIEFGDE